MKSNRFYLACLRDTVGSNVSFHCKNGRGYSSAIERAHEYTREEAQEAWELGREFDLPLCADKADALAEWHVDCQVIPTESETPSWCNAFVAYVPGRWNGNDVYWVRDNGEPTCDFSLATVYDRPNDASRVWLPFDTVDQVKRRTLNVRLIDRRRMVQAAGLLTPDHVKRQRRRNPTGKTRWNCPGCGQISWQFNPYDFHGCKNRNCEKFLYNVA